MRRGLGWARAPEMEKGKTKNRKNEQRTNERKKRWRGRYITVGLCRVCYRKDDVMAGWNAESTTKQTKKHLGETDGGSRQAMETSGSGCPTE